MIDSKDNNGKCNDDMPKAVPENETSLDSKDVEKDEEWTSRTSYVLAAIGSAVGLGNFWRFPFRVFQWGGVFLFPYILILLLIGIPILQLETAIGQTFQSSLLGATHEMNTSLSGVGPAAALVAFLIVSYYATVIAWGVVYFVYSWETPLMWDVSNVHENETDEYITIPSDVFDHLVNASPDPATTYTISSSLFAAVLFCWITVYLILWKGAKMVGKIVWVTVLGPCIILLFLMIWGATLEGSRLGIEAYIGNWDFSVLSNSEIWQHAFGQVFFSLSVGNGVLVSYASFNKRNNNVIQDGLIIGLFDAAFGLFSGFAVFTVAGFYSEQTGIPFKCDDDALENCTNLNDLVGGPGLVFVLYPAALSLIDGYGANILCVLLFLTFFMLGIDSAFSLVESPLTILREFKPLNRFSRTQTLGMLMVALTAVSMLFISDIGPYWSGVTSVINEDLGLLWIAYVEVVLVSWMTNRKEISEQVGLISHICFDLSCFFAVFLFSCLALADVEWYITIPIVIVILLGGVGLSATVLSRTTFSKSLYYLCLHGPTALFDDMSSKIREGRPNNWVFGRMFAINLKFIITPVLTFMLCSTFQNIFVNDAISLAVCSEAGCAPPQYYVGATIMLLGLFSPLFIGYFFPNSFRNDRI